MSMLQQAMSVLGQGILLLTLLVVFAGHRLSKLRRGGKVASGIVLIVALFVPVHGLTLGQWLRSGVGDLSIMSMVLFANIVAQRLFHYNLLQADTRAWLLRGILPAGLIFYPLALGATAIDPYRWGYEAVALVMVLAGLSLLAWIRQRRELAVILLLPVLAGHLGLLESPNLWDYLLDPVVFVYALFQVLLLPGYRRCKNNSI